MSIAASPTALQSASSFKDSSVRGMFEFEHDIPVGIGVLIAILLYIATVTLLVLGIFLGSWLKLFEIPKFELLSLKPRDIEFVLVDNQPPTPPRNKNTKNLPMIMQKQVTSTT